MVKEHKLKGQIGKKIISVVLSVLIFCSVFAIVPLTASADSVTFNDEYMYVDLKNASWIRNESKWPWVKIYGYDSTNYQSMVLVEGTIYRTPNKITGTYSQFTFFARSGTEAENGNACHNIDFSSGKNMFVPNSNYQSTKGSWETYGTGGGVSGDPGEYKEATRGSSFQSGVANKTLFPISAKFYDYYTDYEVTNGWRNGIPPWLYTSYLIGSDNDKYLRRRPFGCFNEAVSDYAGSDPKWYPLYFGNLYDDKETEADGINGDNAWTISIGGTSGNLATGKSLSRYSDWANDSNNLGTSQKMHSVVLNLAGEKLSDSGEMLMHTTSGSDVVAPYFNQDWLLGNNSKSTGLGSVVKSDFPMRITKNNNNQTTYYEFDTDAYDNAWFSGFTSGNLQMNYSNQQTNGAWNSEKFYGGTDNHQVGLFPFESTRGQAAKDYGFGVRFDVDFNLSHNGQIQGETDNNWYNSRFYFTGDDDLWVYVDGVLVLDMGGAHKKASGYIDFSEKKSYITTGYNNILNGESNNTKETAFPSYFGTNGTSVFNNDDPTVKHTLTIFYMERGMIESNLKFGFNMAPIDNKFTTEKEVDVANVNLALRDVVANKKSFNFNASTSSSQDGTYSDASNKTYTYQNYSNGSYSGEEKKTDSQGLFGALKSYDKAAFTNQFEVGSWLKVVEAINTGDILSYDTVWSLYDNRTNETIASDQSGTTANFNFKTTSTEDMAMTDLTLKYTNTPVVSDIKVTKKLVDGSGAEITDCNEDFNFKIELNMAGGSSYLPYALSYKKYNAEGTVLESQGQLSPDGTFKLKATQYIIFEGIPLGVTYKVTETSLPSGYALQSITGGTASVTNKNTTSTVAASGNEVLFTNKEDFGSTSVEFFAEKRLDGVLAEANKFRFKLLQTSPAAAEGSTAYTEELFNTTNGAINFSSISYSDVGTYKYELTEVIPAKTDSWYDKTVIYDTTKYYIEVEVTRVEGSLVATPKFYKTAVTDENQISSTELKFANTTKKAVLEVKKVDKDGNLITWGTGTAGLKAEFKLVAAKQVDGKWVQDTSSTFTPMIINTAETGIAKFDNLPLGNYILTETKAPVGHELYGKEVLIQINKDTVNEADASKYGANKLIYKSGTNEFVSIKNVKKSELPFSGGLGTGMFYCMGAVLVGSAIAMFFAKRRKEQILAGKYVPKHM